MLHALVTLMIDSFALSYYKKHGFHKKGGGGNGDQKARNGEKELGRVENGGAHVGHCHGFNGGANDKDSILLRNRALAQAGYGMKIKAILAFFFSATTPLGIVQALLPAEGHQCADFLARRGSGHGFMLQQWDSPTPRMEVACLRH
ncbi:fe(2+) transport protein 1 [Populus alba x Populus x berolinensis]|nr:fe(2+) transport protein 1 [Populus alba x Populus x berolinensis]